MSDGILNSQEWAALWEKVQAADRYKAALEDIASRSCCDEVCIGPCASTRANDALRGTTEGGPK